MTALNGTRGGRTRRTRRKRHARRKQRTHRKQRSHRNKLRRQSGGANVTYFYEAYEDKVGFLTNFYTRMIGTSCQAGSSEHFNYLFNTYDSTPFMYQPSNMDKAIEFYNSEQAFSYEKALFCAKDPDPEVGINPETNRDLTPEELVEQKAVLKKIENTPDPYIIKDIGSRNGYKEGDKIWKLVKNRPDPVIWGKWATVGVGFMEKILKEKFRPVDGDDEMLQMLLGTSGQYLAEEYDPNWGIGYGRDEANKLLEDTEEPSFESARNNGKMNPFKNHLGTILMKIRDNYKTMYPEYKK